MTPPDAYRRRPRIWAARRRHLGSPDSSGSLPAGGSTLGHSFLRSCPWLCVEPRFAPLERHDMKYFAFAFAICVALAQSRAESQTFTTLLSFTGSGGAPVLFPEAA